MSEKIPESQRPKFAYGEEVIVANYSSFFDGRIGKVVGGLYDVPIGQIVYSVDFGDEIITDDCKYTVYPIIEQGLNAVDK